jgi:hypothetical protein
LEPESAIRWTQGAYEDLRKKSGRFVLFKEVGLPTQGDDKQQLSEAAQAQYYVGLARTPVRFVYFEAFDQPWKTHLPIEPYWGIFRADRQPKRLGSHLLGSEHSQKSANVSKSTKKADFYIYRDADSPQNHFKPTGYMGDAGDIHIDEACETRPASGKTCIRVVYDAKGRGPNICSYTGPCKWAAAYWQHPPNNWGKDEADKAKGFDLSGHKYLRFAARSDKECRIEFKVGGLDARFGDSLTYPRSKLAKLNGDWQEFQIDLDGANLTYIIGGFCWASNWESNPSGATFYLDDIRFVR